MNCPDLDRESERWSLFVRQARDAGFRAVHAAPLRLRSDVVGGLLLFRRRVGLLSDVDQRAARILATAAATGLLHRRAVRDRETVNGQLRQALTSRIAIEQAKGFLVGRYDLTPDAAFLLLRAYARPRRQRLINVAQAVLDRRIDVTGPTEPARARDMSMAVGDPGGLSAGPGPRPGPPRRGSP